MQISSVGIDLIKKYEGFSASSYICPAGYNTIGYGHLICPNEEFSHITKDQAEKLLINDINIKINSVKRLIRVSLTQGQIDALVSFCFNLGSGALQRSSLRQKINRLEFSEASLEFSKWIFVRGVKNSGLLRRRSEEKEIFLCNTNLHLRLNTKRTSAEEDNPR